MAYGSGYPGGYSDIIDTCAIPQGLFLDGAAGDYASTPDSVLNSLQGTESILELSGFQTTFADIPGNTADIAVTADLELRWEGFVDNFITGGASDQQYVISNYNHNVAGFKVRLTQNTSTLSFQASISGSNASASGTHSLAPGTRVRIRVTRVFTTGLTTLFAGPATTDWLALPSLPGSAVVFANQIIPNSATTMKIGNGEGISAFSGRVSNASMVVGGSTVFNPDFSTTPWVIGDVATQARLDGAGKTWTLRGNANIVALAERRSLRVNGTAAFSSTPDNAVLDILGDLDLRVLAALDDWTPATTQDLCAKFSGTGANRSWDFKVIAGGNLELSWSADGTTVLTATSTVPTGIGDQSLRWVRAVLDVDNGAVGRNILFYTSTDGQTYTQLGTTVTQAGVTSIANSNATLDVGGNTSLGRFVTGNIFAVEVRNGIDGTVVANPDFRKLPWVVGATTGTAQLDRTGRTWTLNSSAIIQRAYASDLEVKIRLSMVDWSPAANNTFVSHYDTNSNRAWRLFMDTSARISWAYSVNGVVPSTISFASTPVIPDGTIKWVKVTHDIGGGVNNVKLYLSDDNFNWTLIQQSTAQDIVGFYDSTAALAVGAFLISGSPSELLNGTVYYVDVRNGIDGTQVVNPNFAAPPWEVGDTSPTARPDPLGNIFTLFGTASIIGPFGDCDFTLNVCGGGYAGAAYNTFTYAGAVPCSGQDYPNPTIESNVEEFCILSAECS